MGSSVVAAEALNMLSLERPIKSWFQITRSCNLRCRQCYGDCGRESPATDLSNSEIRSIVNQMIDCGVIELLVEGGEPLMRSDLIDILSAFADRVVVRLRTNAILLDDDVASQLKAIHVTNVLVDFMGSTEETHDWHVQTPGAFAMTIRGLEVAITHGLSPVALMILTKRNIGEVQSFVNLMAHLGVRRVGILRLYPIGRARVNWPELAASLAAQEAAIDAIDIPAGVHLMTSWHPKDNNCCWQATGVTASGHSVGCSYLRDLVDFGDLRRVSFLNTWNHRLAQHLRARGIVSYCAECASTQGSPGGCRATAFYFTGDWDSPDPFCSVTNGGIDVTVLPAHQFGSS